MKTSFLIILLFALLTMDIYSQSTHWQRYYSRGNDEEGYDICTASDGNIYTCGLTSDPRAGWLLKLNPFGDTIWTRRISQMEFIYAIISTNDRGCIIAGNSNKVVKVSTNGDTLWSRQIQGLNINEIIRTNDNNFIACGNSLGIKPFGVKFNESGTIIWQREYAFDFSYFFSVCNAIDGGLILTGFASRPYDKGLILKIDNNGILLWFKTYTIYNSLTWFTAVISNNSTYYLCGSLFLNPDKIFILKTNIYGDTLKSYVLNSALDERYPYIIKGNPNKFYVSCFQDYLNIKIISIDSNFNVLKQLQIFPYDTDVWANKIRIYTGDNSGDILISGTTARNISNEELYAARIDSALTPPPGIGIQQISSEIPNTFSLSQNYPNPFNPKTVIGFQLAVNSFAIIKIFDILGCEVATLVNEHLKPGTYEVTWDASSYPSGVYFYRIIAGDYTQSKKMLLIK